jgi:hypothetical protein
VRSTAIVNIARMNFLLLNGTSRVSLGYTAFEGSTGAVIAGVAIGCRLVARSAILKIDGLPAVGMLWRVACTSARKVEDEFVDRVAAPEPAVEMRFVVGTGFEVHGVIFKVKLLDVGFGQCHRSGNGGECHEGKLELGEIHLDRFFL